MYWSIVHYYNSPLLRLISQHSLVDTWSRPMHDTSQDKLRSWRCQIWSRLSRHPSLTGTLAGLLWVPMARARQVDRRRLETAWASQDLLWERSQENHRTCCTWPGMIWTSVLPCIHAPQFQVKDFDLTFGYTERRWSNTVQPDGSVFSGRRSNRMDEHCPRKIPGQRRLYEGKLWHKFPNWGLSGADKQGHYHYYKFYTKSPNQCRN